MSEEEKEAIEYLNKYIKWETCGERSLEKDIRTILNYIETLELDKKELGLLHHRLNLLIEENKKLIIYNKHLKENSIPTEVIKEKIKELKQEDLKIYQTDSEDVIISKYEQRAVLDVLQDLLENK